MTNYEMLMSHDAVANAYGDDFAKEWYDGVACYWNRGAFGSGSASNEKFFLAARDLHWRWLKAWEGSLRAASYKHIVFDFGWWLFKEADAALLVPVGSTVTFTTNGMMGIVRGHSLDGNYTLKEVCVEFSDGFRTIELTHIRKAKIPASLMELAKSLALKELKVQCPLTGGKENA
jgi:hypothetical protein